MITIEQYFRWPGHEPILKPYEPYHMDAAIVLLANVNHMLAQLDWPYPIDPDTGCSISGAKGGRGDGGFRLATAATGAPMSAHKKAHAVDVSDPGDALDSILNDELLEDYGLYREHQDATIGWTHLQDLPPASKRRTFYP
jgi:hypothetical protein